MSSPASKTRGANAGHIDWAAIHERLARAAAAIEGRAAATFADNARVLAARARELAREAAPQSRPQDQLEVVEFLLAHETYAIESSFVREVYPLRDLTPLPGVPAFVAGIVNVRGKIVSVIDLKRLVDLPARGLTELNKIIVIGNEHMEFGLLADAVLGVQHIPLRSLQRALPTLTGIRAEYLRGVARERLVILDAARILADPKLVVRDEATP